MPPTASHSPSRMPIIGEKDILVLRDILEGKLAGRRPRSCVDGQTITARFICSPHNLLWASRAARNPDLHLRHSVAAGKRRPLPSLAPDPTPPPKVVRAATGEQGAHPTPPTLLSIPDLSAHAPPRPPRPKHL